MYLGAMLSLKNSRTEINYFFCPEEKSNNLQSKTWKEWTEITSLKQSKDHRIFKTTTVEANVLLVDNSWEEQLRSYVRYHDLYLYALLLCYIRPGSSSGSSLLSGEFPVVLHVQLELEGQVQEQQTVKFNSWKQNTTSSVIHWNIHFLLYGTLLYPNCLNFAEDKKERLGWYRIYLLVPTRCSVTVPVYYRYGTLLIKKISPK